ncbi:MAG: hypothetical protein PHV30_07375 [Candidatus Margulisbacteria bacterium]|nr:hypothetical protein [Candidatus Margulisiibacteriota bacterium]
MKEPAMLSGIIKSTKYLILLISCSQLALSIPVGGAGNNEVFSGGVSVNGTVTANNFVGNGSQLTGVVANTATTANVATSMDARGLLGAITVATGNSVVSITTAGYVGIGMTSPSSLLHVGSQSTTTADLTINSEYQGTGFTGSSILNFASGGFNRWRQKTIQKSAGSYSFDLVFDQLSNTIGPVYTERIRINENGNVGVGTANPAQRLHVVGRVRTEYSTSGESGEFFTANSGGLLATHIGSISNIPLAFFTNSSAPKMTLSAGGNLGIGTTSPETNLHIYGTGTSTNLGQLDTNLRLQSYSTTVGGGNEISFRGKGNEDVGTYAAISAPLIANDPNGASGYLAFSTKLNYTDNLLTERMRITASGNIGIGTTAPLSKLDFGTNSFRMNPSSYSGGPYICSDQNFNIVYDIDNNGGFFALKKGDDPATAGGTYVLFADNSGNIGIGTTAPTSKLTVTSVNNYISLLDPYVGTNNSYITIRNSFAGAKISGINLRIDSSDLWQLHTDNGASPINSFFLQYGNSTANRYFTLTSAGKVGISTTNPVDKFTIAGSGGQVISSIYSSTVNTMVLASDTQQAGFVGTKSNHDFWIGASNNTKIAITTAGNVGVGTTSPGAKLDINGTVRSLSNTSLPTSGTGIEIFFQPSPELGLINVIDRATSTWKNLEFRASQFAFSGGNVGVGTTSPDNKVDIQGGAYTQLRLTETKTDNTLSRTGLVAQHYIAGEEPLGLIMGRIDSTTSEIALGGYTSAANAATLISFYTATNNTTIVGSERMRINSSGNIGIGTTNPMYTLSFGSTSGKLGYYSDTSHFAYIEPYNVTEGDMIFNHYWTSGADYRFQNNGIDLVTIKYNGNVGIGLNTPNATLHISGNLTGQPIMEVENANAPNALYVSSNGFIGISTTAPDSMLQVGSTVANSNTFITLGKRITTTETNLPFIGHDSLNSVNSDLGLGATSSSGGINFYTGNAWPFTNANIKMRIDVNGNVGMGTTGPLAKLDVRTTPNTAFDSILFGAQAGGVDLPWIGFNAYTTGTYGATYSTLHPSWDGGMIKFFTGNADSSTNFNFGFVDQATGAFNETVRFLKNGNVGIGTLNPTNKLDVAGAIGVQAQVNFTNPVVGWYEFVNRAPSDYGFRFYNGANGSAGNVVIDSTGNVGIGTTVPQGVLDLGSGTTGRSLVWGGSSGTNFYGSLGMSYSTAAPSLLSMLKLCPTADKYLISYSGTYGHPGLRMNSNGDISFFNEAATNRNLGDFYDYSANTRLIIKAGGNVGIGTFSGAPGAMLQVNVSDNTTYSTGNIVSTHPGIILRNTAAGLGTNNFYSGLFFSQGHAVGAEPGNINAALVNIYRNPNSNISDLAFWAYNDSGVPNETMRIRNNGNVGIGTANPATLLHVYGNGAEVRISNPTGASKLGFTDGTAYLQRNGNNIEYYSPQYHNFTNGNVGIGTTAPTHKLSVVGDVKITGNLTISGALAKGSGSFDIPHPNPAKAAQGYHLRHYFVETDSAGGNLYKRQISCNAGENIFSLPDYFKFLNKDVLVFVSPYKNFGRGYGEYIDNNQYKITVDTAGLYNVLIFGDRKDKVAEDDFNKFGIEYQVQ